MCVCVCVCTVYVRKKEWYDRVAEVKERELSDQDSGDEAAWDIHIDAVFIYNLCLLALTWKLPFNALLKRLESFKCSEQYRGYEKSFICNASAAHSKCIYSIHCPVNSGTFKGVHSVERQNTRSANT